MAPQSPLQQLDDLLTEATNDPKLIFKVMGMVNRRWPKLTVNSGFEMPPSARLGAVRLLVPIAPGIYKLVAFYYDPEADVLEFTPENEMTVAQAKRYFTANVKARAARDKRTEQKV